MIERQKHTDNTNQPNTLRIYRIAPNGFRTNYFPNVSTHSCYNSVKIRYQTEASTRKEKTTIRNSAVWSRWQRIAVARASCKIFGIAWLEFVAREVYFLTHFLPQLSQHPNRTMGKYPSTPRRKLPSTNSSSWAKLIRCLQSYRFNERFKQK